MIFRRKVLATAVMLGAASLCRAQTTSAPSPSPASHVPAAAPLPSSRLSSQASVVVRGFKFTANTRFSAAELDKLLAKYVGQPLTTEQLENARRDVTRHYIDAGYINSGAVLPDQTVADGVITFRIVEGRLAQVDVTFRDAAGNAANHHFLRPGYVADRILFAANPPPMDLLRVKDELELLRQDRNIAAINAELKPGAENGDSRLDVQVRENNPFQVGLQWSNRRNPSVGSTAIDFLASDSDLTGNGDRLSVLYDIANGPVNDPRLDGAEDFSLDYAIPLTPFDTSFAINFTRTNALVTQAPFTDLNIRSRTDSTSFTLRQPIYRKPVAEAPGPGHAGSPSIELDLFVTAALRDNATSLLGRPFSFTPGQENGAGHLTAIRFGQEGIMRSQTDALSARSTFSLGVPWFDSTPNIAGNEAGGKFFSWLGQAQYVHQFAKWDWQLVMRGAAQLSDRPLLPVEQFSLGGIDSVRGYPENYLVRDEGVTGAIELHIPVIRGKTGAGNILTVVPFFDAGYGRNRAHGSAPSQVLDAVGLGLVYTPNRYVNAQIYYGIPLQDHSHTGHDPEDLGVHFSLLFMAN